MRWKQKLKNELRKNNQTKVTFETIFQNSEFQVYEYVKSKRKHFFYKGFVCGGIAIAIVSIVGMIYLTNTKQEKLQNLENYSDSNIQNEQLQILLEEEQKALQQKDIWNKIFEEEVQALQSNSRPENEKTDSNQIIVSDTSFFPSLSNDYLFANGLTYDEMNQRIMDDNYIDFHCVYQWKFNETESLFFYFNTQMISEKKREILEIKPFIEDNAYAITVSVDNVDVVYMLQDQKIEKIWDKVFFSSDDSFAFHIVVYKNNVKIAEESIILKR